MSKPKDLVVHQVPINKLKPAVYNPRRWQQSAIDQLTESIKRFGLIDPLIVNNAPTRHMVVIGGHFRLMVAKDLRLKHVPVVFVTLPDIAKEKELNLRLNRNTGEWDLDLLKNFDIDQLLDIGFDDSDLASIWDEALSIEDDQFDVNKAVEAIDTPRTKPGDLIRLGEHRLICGDATDPKIIKKLVGSETVDILCYDPPYNINLDYHKGVGKTKKYGGKQTDDNKSDQAYKHFLKKCFRKRFAVYQN